MSVSQAAGTTYYVFDLYYNLIQFILNLCIYWQSLAFVWKQVEYLFFTFGKDEQIVCNIKELK